jgi:creatinine amidohydrolase/Fe(II)-dependent formamide hydrolase-like protein
MFLKRNPDKREICISLICCWDLSSTWLSLFALEPEHDFHAGMVETSLMMYWKPELVKDVVVMDEAEISRMMRTDQDWFEMQEKAFDHKYVIPWAHQRKEDKQLGEKICFEMVDGLVEYVEMMNKNK